MIEESTGQVAEHVEAAVTAPERNYEKEASEIGWVPEAEFKGDKEKWKPAQKFVEDGERILPILRANERKLRDELAAERKSFAERLERMEKVNRSTFDAEKRRYETEITRLKREQRVAVESGDLERFDQIELEKGTLRAPEPVEEPKLDPEAIFKKDNAWYGEDEDLTAYANGISQEYLRKHPDSRIEDNLKYTADRVKAAFPGKFKTPAANGHAAVDGGGDFPSPGRSDPLASLPAEAREQARKDMKAFPKIYPTAESWKKAYNS